MRESTPPGTDPSERRGNEAGAAAGSLLVLSNDAKLIAAVRRVLTDSEWQIRVAAGDVLPQAALPVDLRGVIVAADVPAAVPALARTARLFPVVVVSERYDRHRALEAIRSGAADWLSIDQLELLPSVLRRELADADSQAAGEKAALRCGGILVSPPDESGRLDHYCDALLRALGATHALLLEADRGGQMVATGHATAVGCGQPPSLRIAASQLESLRDGSAAAALATEETLGVPRSAHRVWSRLVLEGRLLGIQLVANAAMPFSSEQAATIERLADLVCLAVERSNTVARLRRADAIKTEFVRTVSHELRTPLNTVIGYADLLVEEAFGPLGEEQRRIMRRVGDRARGLLEVIAATLDLPGVDDGRVTLETRPVSIADLFAELEADAREWRVRHDLLYTWDLGDDLPGITTDPGKLRVLLKNLIANAVKFTDRGGITVRVKGRDGGVEFSVEDTGIGIQVEAVHYVFDAFRQANAAAGQLGGVGLGLYIVRRLAGMLGGRLRVESEVGVGSKFHVWLPLTPP